MGSETASPFVVGIPGTWLEVVGGTQFSNSSAASLASFEICFADKIGMPISVKTMRNIWDEERIKRQIEKEMRRVMRGRRMGKAVIIPKAVKKGYFDFLSVKEKSLAEIRKFRKDYLNRKKWASEIFDIIERDLGDAGFSKI